MAQSTDDQAALVEALRPFLVDGQGEDSRGAVSSSTPAALAVMFADLAARIAAVELPAGAQLRATLILQPRTQRLDDTVEQREAVEVEVVDAIGAAVTPGVLAHRQLMGNGSVHHAIAAATPAGLVLDVLTGVEPTAAERAEHARRQAQQTEES